MKGLSSPKSGIQSGMSSIFAPHFGMYALSPLNKEYCRVTFFFNNQEVFNVNIDPIINKMQKAFLHVSLCSSNFLVLLFLHDVDT
jgi:hypothetical protein